MDLYGTLAEAAFFLGRPLLQRKYGQRGGQRWGYFSEDVPRRSLWIHAVSVGEVQSAFPFIRALFEGSFQGPVLLSTTTATGRTMANQLLEPYGDRVQTIYYPWDAPSVVRRALDALEPRCYVNMETEIWPEMVNQLAQREIPLFLVNGRLSESSFQKYRRLKGFWKRVINRYSLVLVRNDDDRRRFADLGVDPRKLHVTGDCKVDALIERRDSAVSQTEELKKVLGPGPIVLAGSTHQGEETLVLQAYGQVRRFFPQVRLVLAPRHPDRAQSLLAQAQAVAPCCLLSQLRPEWEILVVDRIGVLFPLYGLAQCAFIGGSLVPKGGQNIMEPAIWGVPFCQGTDFRDFQEPTELLRRTGLCTIVQDGQQMAEFFLKSLSEAKAPIAQGSVGLLEASAGASRRSWALIDGYIRSNQVKLD